MNEQPPAANPHPDAAQAVSGEASQVAEPAQGSASSPLPRRADARFLLAHPAHWIALGFGTGLSPFAPGTVGTLWAWLVFVAAYPALMAAWGDAGIGLLLLAAVGLGWWASTVTARHLGVADPGCVVWDEVVGFWLVLWLVMPTGWLGQTAAFVLFRFFDMVKPGPVRWADRHFKGFGPRGGFGILLDDLVAGACAVLVVALWRHVFGP